MNLDSSWRWIRRGDYNDSSYSPINKSSTSVMIWACIGPNYKSQLMIIDNNNSESYCEVVVNSGLVEEDYRENLMFGWFFSMMEPHHITLRRRLMNCPIF